MSIFSLVRRSATLDSGNLRSYYFHQSYFSLSCTCENNKIGLYAFWAGLEKAHEWEKECKVNRGPSSLTRAHGKVADVDRG